MPLLPAIDPPRACLDSVGETGSLRLGLCCQFIDQPIAFRTTTATYLLRHSRRQRLQIAGDIALHNVIALEAALAYCASRGILSFRIISSLLPVQTHPSAGYSLGELPVAKEICETLERCRLLARARGIRTGFHPDQFIVLSSPDAEIVRRAVADLHCHAELAKRIGADTINIHGGGAYGDKAKALGTLQRNLDQLAPAARSRLTLENDDKIYAPADLLPFCERNQIPLVYDVHHHRCHPDGLSVEEATIAARETWMSREPLFHISSPLGGWRARHPERHDDYIAPADFPGCWMSFPLTVEVEAKAKELAVLRLRAALHRRAKQKPTSREPSASPKELRSGLQLQRSKR